MSPAPRILFFADAGAAVGGGHIMRCLTLAHALRARGAACAFVATSTAAGVLDAFADAGIERLAIEQADLPTFVAAVAQAARVWGAAAVVVDHYGVDRAMERTLGEGRSLLAMDDLRRPHDSDLVLDSNLDRRAADYAGVEALVGPVFALVRPEFIALRSSALARRAQNQTSRRLLVSLGLTDVGGVTARVMTALADDLTELQVDVVVGAAAPSLTTLRALAAADDRITLHIGTHRMATLTAAADLAIGAGGSSTWERCCLGLPTITLVLADNQRANAAALAKRGATLMLEGGIGSSLAAGRVFEDQLREMLKRIRADANLCAATTRAASALCDGEGAERVAERLLALCA